MILQNFYYSDIETYVIFCVDVTFLFEQRRYNGCVAVHRSRHQRRHLFLQFKHFIKLTILSRDNWSFICLVLFHHHLNICNSNIYILYNIIRQSNSPPYLFINSYWVKNDTDSLVCTLNGPCLGICGEASYREKHLTLAERRRNYHFKINDDDDDDEINLFKIAGFNPLYTQKQ